MSTKPEAIIVDIDGTIADCAHRAIFVNNPEGTKDWKSFNARMDRDTPKYEVLRVIEALAAQGIAVLLVTGRFEEFRQITVKWLLENKIGYNLMIMRPNGDFRSDHTIKKEIYHEHIYPYFDVVGVFDDRDSVVEMWREQGLTCFQVQKGDY